MSRGSGAPLLSPGDAIGVASPGFAVQESRLRAGVARLRQMGFRPVLGPHVLARSGYLAGTDDQRAADLRAMLADPALRAVWFARGGYGTARLLQSVSLGGLRRHPKLLIGYSDLTALFSAALRIPGQLCVYGPVVAELGERRSHDAASLRALLAGRAVTLAVPARGVLRHGRASGRLMGGNLTVLAHLLGTRHAPDLRGAVLFIEDVGESVYRLDRLLVHLSMSGRLSGVKAVLVGSFAPSPSPSAWLADRPVRELIRETFLPLGVPVVTGIRAGHLDRKRSLPLGGRARLDTRNRRLVVEPRAVRG